ncbi:terminase family protein [Micromonospora sp. NPDC049081]|uniref:PBSX family phage terminase large subunit n=1 Tax=Micromonospora sp. NPDC049081 TaxID=3155150 RepID=UPI003406DCF7
MANLDGLPLSRKQILSIAASAHARTTIWSGAVRSGKTIASLVAFLIQVSQAPPSGLVLICGRTLQTIERNILEPMQDPALFGAVADLVHHTRGAPTATILGRTVHLIGASDARAEGRLRGLTACLALLDEGTLVPEGFFNQLLARLSVPGAKCLITTNPDGPGHWLRKNFILRSADLGIAHFHFTLDDNPALDPAYVAAIKAEYVGLFYRRFVLGEWCMAEGAIYDMWDADQHVVDTVPPIWKWLAAGVDYGTTNPLHGVLVGMDASQTLYVASEYRYDSKEHRRSLTDTEYSAAFGRWLARYRQDNMPSTVAGVRPETVVVDPSASSFIQQLWRDGWSPTAANNAVADGIRTVSTLLAGGKLKVHRSCRALIDEFPSYSWDETKALRGEDVPIKVEDHGLDALRYAVHTTEASWRLPHMADPLQWRRAPDGLDLATVPL